MVFQIGFFYAVVGGCKIENEYRKKTINRKVGVFLIRSCDILEGICFKRDCHL